MVSLQNYHEVLDKTESGRYLVNLFSDNGAIHVNLTQASVQLSDLLVDGFVPSRE